MIKHISYLLLVLMIIHGKTWAEERIVLPAERLTKLEVKDSEGKVLFAGIVGYPFDPNSEGKIPKYESYPYTYTFSNDDGARKSWLIDSGQEPVFYISGTLKRHYTRNPIVVNGSVVVEHPVTGEVYHRMTTKGDGTFDMASTRIPDSAPDYIKVSVVGGRAVFTPRDPGNVMTAIVTKRSFSLGSVTLSMSTTAAYLSAKHQLDLGNISISDFYKVYNENVVSLVDNIPLPSGTEFHEALYLNKEDQKPVRVLPFSTQEVVELTLFDNVTVMEIMSAPPAEQIEKIKSFYGTLHGWTDYWHKQNQGMLSGRPIEIEVIGESTVDVTIEKHDGAHVSTRTFKGDLVPGDDPSWPKYILPKIILGKHERMRLSLNPAPNWKPHRWVGCSSYTESTCVVAHNSYGPSVLLLEYEPDFEPDVAPESHKIDLSIFNLKGDTFVGREGVPVFSFHFMVALEIGEKIRGDDNVVYEIIDINLPEVSSPEPGDFKIKVVEAFHPI